MTSTSAAATRIAKPIRHVADSWITNPQLLKGSGSSEKSAHAVRFLTVPSATCRLVTCGSTRGYGGISTSSRGPYYPLRAGVRARE